MIDTPVHYYIYYRVDSASAEPAWNAVTQILELVERRAGVSGRWLRRADEPLLWMEVYEAVHDATGFEAALTQAVAESGLGACLEAGAARKTERFVVAPPRA